MGLSQTYNSIFPGLADTTELHPQAPDLPAARKWLFLLKGLRKFIGKGTDRAHRMTGEFTPLSPQLTSGKEGNCKAVLESLRAKEQSFLLLAWFPMMFAVCQHQWVTVHEVIIMYVVPRRARITPGAVCLLSPSKRSPLPRQDMQLPGG